MPELRRDPIIGRWVIIAKERGERPYDFVTKSETVEDGFCPLCPGNEFSTPREVLLYENMMPEPGWNVRVVPNKFPALVIEGELDKRGEGIYDKMNGIGAHEVIIDTPDHHATFYDMSQEQLVLVFRAYRDRIVDLEQDSRFKYIIVFKNYGQSAGASLEHSHSQLIALPVIPQRIQEEINGCKRYFDYKERCVFCDIIRQERHQETRVVTENESFITICPFAPRSPFEMWIMPRQHRSRYIYMSETEIYDLADIFATTMKMLDRALPSVSYNFMLHTTPLRHDSLEYYHWHFEIVPKVTSIAGFEWGSGFYINPMPPEDACRYLREVEL
jgi:UDPglucose--hexose-1-phosphate uridylyltransferase